MAGKLWGGRFKGGTHGEVESFTSSLELDFRLWKADLTASAAHARALRGAGVLTAEECEQLTAALQKVGTELEGATARGLTAEDIHSEIEQRLARLVGGLAGKLHTGRSRNDQVATATRLYLREEIEGACAELHSLQGWLVSAAKSNTETLLPGLTHMQHAQPVSLAHHLLAYFWMLERDRQRFEECLVRVNALPLGSAALAGTSYAIDREAVARELGFASVCENSLDAVSDRDFVVEYLAAGSLLLVHLSRLAEELCLWSTPEFGFITLSDAVTTGSSIMPQKKNPDVAELIRGRTGRLVGALTGALTMLKGLPLAYNRDLQEDKVHLFAGVDTVRSCVRLTELMLSEVTFHPERMRSALDGDFSNATDLADYLVKRNVPFREAHEIVGRIVRDCLDTGVALESLTLEKLRTYSAAIGEEALQCLQPEQVLRARTTDGGTSPQAVLRQIVKANAALAR